MLKPFEITTTELRLIVDSSPDSDKLAQCAICGLPCLHRKFLAASAAINRTHYSTLLTRKDGCRVATLYHKLTDLPTLLRSETQHFYKLSDGGLERGMLQQVQHPPMQVPDFPQNPNLGP